MDIALKRIEDWKEGNPLDLSDLGLELLPPLPPLLRILYCNNDKPRTIYDKWRDEMPDQTNSIGYDLTERDKQMIQEMDEANSNTLSKEENELAYKYKEKHKK